MKRIFMSKIMRRMLILSFLVGGLLFVTLND